MNDELPGLNFDETFQRWLREQYEPDGSKDEKARQLRAENLRRSQNHTARSPSRVS